MQGRCHIQILFLLSRNYNGIWRVILISNIAHYCGLICWVNSYGILCTHSHFFLKIYFGLLIALVSILNLSISFINQMIARRDMVMTVILDAFLSILSVKIILHEELFEELVLNWHFLLAREESHVTVAIFHLKGPSVVSDVGDAETSIGVCV